MAVACRDVEAAALARDGSPPITRITFPTCRAHYPGGSSGCACRLLPRSRGLPQMAGGSASALSLSRPAQASLALRPVGLLSRLKRPLSRGSSPSGYPAEPLVSYQINRQLSGWKSSSTSDPRLRGALPLADITLNAVSTAELASPGADLNCSKLARGRGRVLFYSHPFKARSATLWGLRNVSSGRRGGMMITTDLQRAK